MNTATSQFDGHTPREWKINAINSRTNRVVGDETSAGWDKLHITGGNRTIAVVYREADSRLIAAAPELLRQRDELAKSCRALLDVLYENPTHGLCTGPRAEWEIECVRSALASIENGA